MMQPNQSPTSQANNAPQFNAVESAAARLVDLLCSLPKAKEILNTLSTNHEEWKKEVAKLSELLEPEKRAEFIAAISEKRPIDEMKASLIKFIAKNFEHHQIEYAINLSTDLRLGDLLKQTISVFKGMGKRFSEGFRQFAKELDSKGDVN